MAKRSVFLLCVLGMMATTLGVRADNPEPVETPTVIVFYEEGCPNCIAMDELLAGLATDLGPSAVQKFEITVPGNLTLLRRLQAAYGIDVATVPIVFVGDTVIAGMGRAQEFQLRAAIGDCATVGCSSPLDRLEPTMPLWRSLVEVALLGALVLALALLQIP